MTISFLFFFSFSLKLAMIKKITKRKKKVMSIGKVVLGRQKEITQFWAGPSSCHTRENKWSHPTIVLINHSIDQHGKTSRKAQQ